MGKFESYPEANALADNDITLYNKSGVTHKVTFSRIVNLIKNKIAATGLVTSITAGAGLAGGTITSSGTVKCKLKSETLSSLASNSITTTTNRQYAVGLDKDGNLSVNIPWDSSSDKMDKDGNNASAHVRFSGAFTVGTRTSASAWATIGTNSYAQGSYCAATGLYSHAEGANTVASSSFTHAEGRETMATHNAAHAEGCGSNLQRTSDLPSIYIQRAYSISANGQGSHAEGYTSGGIRYVGIIQSNGYGTHAEGYANGDDDTAQNGIIIASGTGSHAEGVANFGQRVIASGYGTHAEGVSTRAYDTGSHAEGCYTYATNTGSHAEGSSGNDVIDVGGNQLPSSLITDKSPLMAYGRGSHAEGCADFNIDMDSIESGHITGTTGVIQAYGEGSHAEGSAMCDDTYGAYIFAEGKGSHAEGYTEGQSGIHAQGLGSHAEGYADYQSNNNCSIVSSGKGSHAEGWNTSATGIASHAEGRHTTANADYSHAGGCWVTALEPCQFVQGGTYDKFENMNYDKGVFGVSPNVHYYTSDDIPSGETTLNINAPNGYSACAENVSLTLQLAQCAIYVLYWTIYNNSGESGARGITYIFTAKTSSGGTPRVEELTGSSIANPEINNKLEIAESAEFMFHLIRII